MEEKRIYPELEVEYFIQMYGDRLTEREKDIVRLRHGLIEGKKCTRLEVAMIMGVSVDRIRYIESKIARKFIAKKAMRRKEIQNFYE